MTFGGRTSHTHTGIEGTVNRKRWAQIALSVNWADIQIDAIVKQYHYRGRLNQKSDTAPSQAVSDGTEPGQARGTARGIQRGSDFNIEDLALGGALGERAGGISPMTDA